MQKLAGVNYTESDLIQAKICDTLSLLWWAKTKDGQNNRNRPEMILDKMLNTEKEVIQDFEHDVFMNAEEFERVRKKCLEG